MACTKGSSRFHRDPLHHHRGDPLDSIGIHCITNELIQWIPSGSTASHTKGSTVFHRDPLHHAPGDPRIPLRSTASRMRILWVPSGASASGTGDPLDSIGIQCITHRGDPLDSIGINFIKEQGIHWIPMGSTASCPRGFPGFHRDPLHHAQWDALGSIGIYCITKHVTHCFPLESTSSRMRGSTGSTRDPLH